MVPLGDRCTVSLTAELTENQSSQERRNQADYRAEHGEPNGYLSRERSVCFHEPLSLSFMIET
jgi:hypothetical protein